MNNNLQEQISNKLKEAIKNKQDTRYLKVVVGEMQRLKNKKVSNEEVELLLKRLIDLEKENLEAQKLTSSEYLVFLESFMPEKISDEKIIAWIKENVDFSKLGNKFAAIKEVKKCFGVKIDGENVKKIILEKF